jgi:predicted GNAT family N-acyltransferase
MLKPQLTNVKIKQVTWREAENDLRAVRTPVFIEEQAVTPEFEWDELDAGAVHLLAVLQDFNSVSQPTACLRIIDYHKIGRMAVLKEFRGNGLGAMLLKAAVEICKLHKSKVITLSAQTHAIEFYGKAGFKVTSDEYCDVHIPHVDMQLTL